MKDGVYCFLGDKKDCLVDVTKISFISGTEREKYKTCIQFDCGECLYTSQSPEEVIKQLTQAIGY